MRRRDTKGNRTGGFAPLAAGGGGGPISNPTDPSDGGGPANCMTVKLTVGDPGGSYSERWILEVKEDGSDTDPFNHCDEDFGTPGSKEYPLTKGKAYTLRLKWVDTNLYYNGEKMADFDWRCRINNSTAAGARSALHGTGVFFVEDPDGLLTFETHGDDENITIGREGRIYVPKIITETLAISPSDRTRKTLGVGETVKLQLIPDINASVTWNIDSGDGILVGIADGSAYYTARDTPTVAMITAEIGGCACPIKINVIKPTGIFFEHKMVTDIFSYPNTPYLGDRCDVNIYAQPDTVNFYAVSLHEGGSFLYYDGCFTDWGKHTMRNHDPNGSHRVTMDVVNGKGSLCSQFDSYGGAFAIDPNANENGLSYWLLDWAYTIDDGEQIFIEQLKQLNTIVTTNSLSTWTTTKDVVGFRISSGDTQLTVFTSNED